MSTELHTLSGAYAINALSAEEAADFERHLEQCPACRDEVRELQDAAARMGASEAIVAPAALRTRVLAAADRAPQLPPKVVQLRRRGARGWLPKVVGAAAAVLLAVTGTVAVLNSQDPDPSPPVAGPRVDSGTSEVAAVFEAPDAHTAAMRTMNGGRLVVATSAEFGQMAVRTSGLPRVEGRAYQMWAIRNGRATSVGVVEDLRAGKVMPMPPAGTTVALTIEPAGGSKQPTQEPIITMDPESV